MWKSYSLHNCIFPESKGSNIPHLLLYDLGAAARVLGGPRFVSG